MMRKLREGMRAGDLCDLLLPLISIDEYESKVSAEAVVIGIYVHDKDAASDLNRFIQKSALQILDTDISPAPDSHGYYLVFIELDKSKQLTSQIVSILHEISPLVGINDWRLRIRGEDDLIDINASKNNHEELEKLSASLSKMLHENAYSVLEYLSFSELSNASRDGELLILEGFGKRASFRVVDFGKTETVLECNKLNSAAQDFSMTGVSSSRMLENMLGENWNVTNFHGTFVLLNQNDAGKCLILRKK